MSAPAIVRFAPSPTGPPHLGSLRTALFDWLLARATGGRFILRIDDTDRSRYDPQAEEQMIEALRWLRLQWDEGPDIGGPHAPYRQSERLALYHEAAEWLIEAGAAYRPADAPQVVRLKTPRRGRVAFRDALRGEIAFNYARVPRDPVLIKSDGYPTYHLASVVDDHHMGITHVLRGEEWIPSTPLHLLIFAALGWEAPIYVHLPLVVDKEGQKLKKRDPRALALTYRDQGYLPEGVVNYLALLGWHPGSEQELFTPAELIAHFKLERLSKSAATFDEDRLRWFSRQHLATLPLEDLAARTLPLLRAAYPQAAERSEAWLTQLVALVRDEMSTLNDVVTAARFALGPPEIGEEACAVLASEAARPVLEAFRAELAALQTSDAAACAALLKELRARFRQVRGWDGRTVMFPIRAALTGTLAGPHLADIVALLGKEESLRRIHQALSLL